MSRALDRETVAALQSGDPSAAYRAIAAVLTEPASAADGLLEIEFLSRGQIVAGGSANGFFLRDGNAVAVHKLALVQAFFVARGRLKAYQAAAAGKPKPSTDDILAATAVILLFDPEHLTAANTRKRVLVRARAAGSTDQAVALVARERRLVDSLLTSHLHRHTKSPTLWSHRCWLATLRQDMDDQDDWATINSSLDVVLVAAVRHPRNYYAWDHARWLVVSRDGPAGDVDALVPRVRDWCCRHHDDTSGWSFLFFLLARVPARLAETLAHVQQTAASLRWTGESVWVFLQTAGRWQQRESPDGHGNDGPCGSLRQTARVLQSGLDPASTDWRVLQQAQDWMASVRG